jgi:diaminopimelate decarboxylase
VNITARAPAFVYRSSTSPVSKAASSRDRGSDELHCEQVSLSKLARRFGTPLYVYSSTAIRERVSCFREAFHSVDHEICYSVKANSNLAILRLLAKLHCGFDVVSGGELERVRLAHHRSAGRVVFSGVGKTITEMEAALRAGILMFNVESAFELEALAKCAARLKKKAAIAFRVNPDVPADTHPYVSTGLHKHKFGVPLQEARELYARAAGFRSLQVAGVSLHIGSQITDAAPFKAAMQRAAELVWELRSDGHAIRFIDAGGGLGIDYQGAHDFSAALREYSKSIIEPLRDLKVKLLLEPGRSIVGAAGVLVTRVLYRKKNGLKKFVVVDAAMNDMIRPSLYQAEHQIVPVVSDQRGTETVDVVGPVCESGDFFARNRKLPHVEAGELLALLDAGAYGMALASNYNSRPRSAEVLVDRKSARIIRKRETVRDLVRQEM